MLLHRLGRAVGLVTLLLACGGLLARPTEAQTVPLPTSVSISKVSAFTDIIDSCSTCTGSQITDLLVIADYNITYATNPTTGANLTWLGQLIGLDGMTVVGASAPVPFSAPATRGYGDGSVAVYLTSAQVAAAGITYGSAISFRLIGNPSFYPVLIQGITSASGPACWAQGNLCATSNVVTIHGYWLSQYLISRGSELAALWTQAFSPVTLTSSGKLATTGEDYFTQVFSAMQTAAPQAFSSTITPADLSYVTPPRPYGKPSTGPLIGTMYGNSISFFGPTGMAILWILIACASCIPFQRQFQESRHWVVVIPLGIWSAAVFMGFMPILWALLIPLGAVVIIAWALFLSRSYA